MDKKNSVFRQCIDLNEVQGHLIRLFKDKVSLEYAENRENINLIFTMFTMSGTTLVVFELEKKTMEEKDDGLNFLYKIEKTNYDLMDKILRKYQWCNIVQTSSKPIASLKPSCYNKAVKRENAFWTDRNAE